MEKKNLRKAEGTLVVRGLQVVGLCLFFGGILPVLASDADSAGSSSPYSFNYSLVGTAQLDGILYASFRNLQTQTTFLLSSNTSEDGWKLISVGSSDNHTGSFAIVEKQGVSLHLKTEVGSLKNLTFRKNFQNPDNAIPLTPPIGASLPLVFKAVDLHHLNLSDEQQQEINQLRRDFLGALNEKKQPSAITASAVSDGMGAITGGGNSEFENSPANNSGGNAPASNGDTSVQQLEHWQTAQERSDEQLRTVIGWEAFSRYLMALSN